MSPWLIAYILLACGYVAFMARRELTRGLRTRNRIDIGLGVTGIVSLLVTAAILAVALL